MTWRRANFTCPKCGARRARRHSGNLRDGRRRRTCLACNFSFTTMIDAEGIEVFECEWLPVLRQAQKEKPGGPDGYGPPAEREFELAPHHHLVDYREFGPLDPRYEQAEGHFRLLRGPAGRPVARQHADLRPGEISLVLE